MAKNKVRTEPMQSTRKTAAPAIQQFRAIGEAAQAKKASSVQQRTSDKPKVGVQQSNRPRSKSRAPTPGSQKARPEAPTSITNTIAEKTKTLTNKQSAFVEEYLIGLNATKAAIRAGYSEKTAYSQGQRLLKNAETAEAIKERMAERSNRTEIDADYVERRLQELESVDFRQILDDSGAIKPMSDWPESISRSIVSFEVLEVTKGDQVSRSTKIRLESRSGPLKLLGQHKGMFDKRLTLAGDTTQPLTGVEIVFVNAGEARRD